VGKRRAPLFPRKTRSAGILHLLRLRLVQTGGPLRLRGARPPRVRHRRTGRKHRGPGLIYNLVIAGGGRKDLPAKSTEKSVAHELFPALQLLKRHVVLSAAR
jgi:hypothetical protein